MANLRQQEATKIVLETGGKSVSKAMIKAGYSPATAKNPKKLTQSKYYQNLIKKYLPVTKVLRVHNQGLEANKVISAPVFPGGKDGKPINDFIEVPDWQSRAKFVEMAYKRLGFDNVVELGLHFHQHIESQREKYEV